MIDFSTFPWVDHFDFECVSIDVTKWEHGTYSCHFVYLRENSDETASEGCIINTDIGGKTLTETWHKVKTVIETGLFGSMEVLSHGALYDENGDEIGTICWDSLDTGTPCKSGGISEVAEPAVDLALDL